jgi:hypothetical protein
MTPLCPCGCGDPDCIHNLDAVELLEELADDPDFAAELERPGEVLERLVPEEGTVDDLPRTGALR